MARLPRRKVPLAIALKVALRQLGRAKPTPPTLTTTGAVTAAVRGLRGMGG